MEKKIEMTKEDITMKKSILCYILNHFNVNYHNLKNKLDRKEQKVQKKKKIQMLVCIDYSKWLKHLLSIEKLQVLIYSLNHQCYQPSN